MANRFPTFCPACGGVLEYRHVEEEERSRDVCPACGYIYYLNPKIVAGTIPMQEGSIWLLRRAIEPRYGAWTFPAGFMELGETVEEAAARETMEELTLQVRLGPLVGIYGRPPSATVHIVYAADAISLPGGGKETLEFSLFEPEYIPWPELAFWSTTEALRQWVRMFHPEKARSLRQDASR